MFGRIVCLCVFCGHFCFMPVICKWIHLSGSNPWLHNHENVTTCICASIIESSVFILSFSFFTLLCWSKEVGIGSACRLTNSVTKLFVFFDNPLSGLPSVCCRWGGGGWGWGNLNPPCTDYLSIFNMKFTNFSSCQNVIFPTIPGISFFPKLSTQNLKTTTRVQTR